MRVSGLYLIVLLATAKGAAAAEESVWQDLPLPGGVAGLARAAGLDAGTEPWRVLYETSRRLHPTYGDPADAARLRERVRAQLRDAAPRLARGPARPAKGRTEASADDAMAPLNGTVALPLPSRVWNKALLRQPVPDDRLVQALLDDREASLAYRGLFQLDEPTLRFLAAHPELVSWIGHNQTDAFSVFAGSLRVREGRALVPGGQDAEPLWVEVVGESPARAERFLPKLLAHDEGRTAFLFHTLDRLEGAAQRFALGQTDAGPGRRRLRFRALAAAFAQGPAWWRHEGGVFARPLVDPAVALRLVKVTADGRPAPPASRAFWEAAFSGDVSAKVLANGPDAFDAAWLAENVGQAPSPEKRRERLTQMTFAQRVFGAIAPGESSDALVTLRGLARYPALVLVLDRMGVRRPTVYAQAVRRADEIAALRTDRKAIATMAQFQGAMALLDHARFVHTLDSTDAEALVESLAALPVAHGGYHGAVAEWIEKRLLPAVAPLVDVDPASTSGEETLLGALAGDRLLDEQAAPFEWEGLWYRAEPGVGERRRLRAVRARQGGNRLDAVLVFSQAARRFQERPDAPGLAHLREAAKSVDPSLLSSADQQDVRSLGAGSARRAQALVDAADQLLAETLTSLAYAPHLGSAQGAPLAGASVAARHEFGAMAWELPEEVLGTGAPWHVRGAILGLDVALARLCLRRLTADMPSHAPGLDPQTSAAFARSIVLRSPFALEDDEATAIAEALARGRERAGAPDKTAEILAKDAGLDAWRTRGLHATLLAGPGSAASFFTLGELLRLGRPNPPPGDDWGTPDLVRGGSLRLFLPPSGGYADLAGQRLEELHAARLSDLVLRVAAELHARRLPARLVPGVMSLFVQDFVQEAVPLAHDDWLALARYARDAPAERFDEYVSALAGEGPLVPAPDPGARSTP